MKSDVPRKGPSTKRTKPLRWSMNMADKPFPTFQIVEFPDEACVIGRNCGSEVVLGNVFTRIVRQDFIRSTPNELHMIETTLADGLSIELVEIEMYQRNCDLRPSGYTAKLLLAGADASKLYSLRDVLGPHVYLAIESPTSS